MNKHRIAYLQQNRGQPTVNSNMPTEKNSYSVFPASLYYFTFKDDKQLIFVCGTS